MYASLDKVDAITKAPVRYVQTDHRTSEEIEENPDISTLFALARILSSQQHATTQGIAAEVVYVTPGDVPDLLKDVLAATGATHQLGTGGPTKTYAPGDESASELADRAFRGLAKQVSRRVGLTDMATVLRALEAETLADPPVQAEDEAAYWTRVLELAAVTCEIVRARSGGRWEIQHLADVPFGFATSTKSAAVPAGAPGPGGIMLATNRAHRFIADGKDESMFLLLAADREVSAGSLSADDLPVMPNLRSRREAIASELAWRPLFSEPPDDDDFPVVVYGHDTPETFGAFRAGRAGDLDGIHQQALGNITSQDVATEEVEIEGVSLLAVSGSYYAAEKLLDREFMRGLHRRLGHDILAVSVPRRGLMFVTAVERDDKRELIVLQAATKHEAKTTRTISEAILLVRDGVVAGHVEISAGASPASKPRSAVDVARRQTIAAEARPDERDERDAPAPPAKKPGWLARLFGRKK